MSNEKTTEFLAAYKELQEVERIIREMKELDVDAIVGLVNRAMTAHAICKQRIDAVRATLDTTLAGVTQ